MNDKKNLLIAGGDLRQIYCGKKLSQEYNVFFLGFDEKYIPENMKSADGLSGIIYTLVVFSVSPLRNENGIPFINTPFSEKKIPAGLMKKYISPDTLIFCGKPDDTFLKIFKGNKIFDYVRRQDFSILNAILTAEGAVQTALEEMPSSLSGKKVLITGFGRIAKSLSIILRGFGADVHALARSSESKAWAKLMNVRLCEKSEIGSEFDLIFNTAPEMILDKAVLKKLDPKVLIIDLASVPGGTDFEYAEKLNLKTLWLLGIPGKTAPVSAGNSVADTIESILRERSENNHE